MKRFVLLIGVAVAGLAGWAAVQAETVVPLDADTLQNVLRTRDPDESTYLTYVATLVSQGQLPHDLVASTLLWARKKPDPKKTQYFKQALILRARDVGIDLPAGTPSLKGAIEGRVYLHVLLVDVPAVGVQVRLGNTQRTATTDAHGQFRFDDVPFGVYRLQATGVVSLLTRNGSTTATVPSPPPSTAPTRVQIAVQ